MKKESKLQIIKGYMPVIVTRKYLDGLHEEIEQSDNQADDFNRMRQKEKAEKDQLQKDINQLEEIKNKEIERLKNKISSQSDELNSKNKSLEIALKEKEEKSFKLEETTEELSSTKRRLSSYIAISSKQTKHIKDLKDQIKVLTKLKIQNEDSLEAKDLVIAEDRKLIEELQEKNRVQASKIKEFSKEVEHNSLEYQEDGLPKPTKEILSKRKFRRKKSNKKEGK